MCNLTCNTIRDILPLYVDGVVSEDTCILVEEHLARCPQCQKVFERMKSEIAIPVEGNVTPLKRFKRSWKKKKIAIAAVSTVMTLLILFAGYLVYENVEIVHDFFSPATRITVRITAPSDQWQRLSVGETGYLRFDNIFYDKELVLDGNSDAQATFRIKDQQGNILVDALTLQPGTGAELKELESNTDYIVEIKSDGPFLAIGFF